MKQTNPKIPAYWLFQNSTAQQKITAHSLILLLNCPEDPSVPILLLTNSVPPPFSSVNCFRWFSAVCAQLVCVCDKGCLPLGSLSVTLPCGSRYCLVVFCTVHWALVLCWRFTLYKCFIIIIIIKSWNSLPSDIRHADSLDAFNQMETKNLPFHCPFHWL